MQQIVLFQKPRRPHGGSPRSTWGGGKLWFTCESWVSCLQLSATVCNCDFGHRKGSPEREAVRTAEASFCWSLFLGLSWKPQHGECLGKSPVGFCQIGVLRVNYLADRRVVPPADLNNSDESRPVKLAMIKSGYRPLSAASVSTREPSTVNLQSQKCWFFSRSILMDHHFASPFWSLSRPKIFCFTVCCLAALHAQEVYRCGDPGVDGPRPVLQSGESSTHEIFFWAAIRLYWKMDQNGPEVARVLWSQFWNPRFLWFCVQDLPDNFQLNSIPWWSKALWWPARRSPQPHRTAPWRSFHWKTDENCIPCASAKSQWQSLLQHVRNVNVSNTTNSVIN